MPIRQAVSVSAIVFLAACGGSGASFEDPIGPLVMQQEGSETATEQEIESAVIQLHADQQAAADISTASQLSQNTFAIADETIIVTLKTAFADRVPMLDIQTLDANYNPNQTITLTQGTNSVVLTPDSDGNYSGSSGEVTGFLQRRYLGAEDVDLVFFNFNDATFRREGFLVFGNNTAASTVADLTGTATYTGLANARITGPGTTRPVHYNAIGGGRLNIDFDTQKLSGRIDMSDPKAGLFKAAGADQFPRISVILEETNIVDGRFGNTATVAFKDGGGLGNPELSANDDGTYSGDFYGEAGQSAAGIFSGTINNAGETFVLQGAFAVD